VLAAEIFDFGLALDLEPEPGADNRTEFALSCRMYGASGVPPRDLLVAALQES
jgi:hypothetical protein